LWLNIICCHIKLGWLKSISANHDLSGLRQILFNVTAGLLINPVGSENFYGEIMKVETLRWFNSRLEIGAIVLNRFFLIFLLAWMFLGGNSMQ
jgi:hypothetical protein